MDRTVSYREYLADCRRAVSFAQPWGESGRLTRVAGLVMEAVGLRLPIGSQCLVQIPSGQNVDAEVVGFADSIHFDGCQMRRDIGWRAIAHRK